MSAKPVLFITGANTGLGLETVKSLVQSTVAYTILLGGRDLGKANAAAKEVQSEFPSSTSKIDTVQIDIDSDESINAAYDTISGKYGRVDILINNAGGQFDGQAASGQLSIREMWNKSWNTNTAGTHVLTHTLAPLLLKSSSPRLLFITSGTSTMTEHYDTSKAKNVSPLKAAMNKSPPAGWPKENSGYPAYRSSKAGMNMMMREWARVLKEDGVQVFCISPGFLATGLGGGGSEALKKMGAGDPTVGANFIKDVVEGKRDADAGLVIRRNDVQAW